MESLTPLASKDLKEFYKLLEKQYGFTEKLDFLWFRNEKQKIFIMSRDLVRVNFENVRINSLGLYFAQLKDGTLRLSVEGSRIVGPKSSRVIDLNASQITAWIKGEDVELLPEQVNEDAFFIVRSGKDYFGSGKVSVEKSMLFNYYPKARRISELFSSASLQ